MSVLEEVITSCEVYKQNTGEIPRFIVIPAPRARVLVADLIKYQAGNAPEGLHDALLILDDVKFAEFMNGFSLQGIRIMVLIEQLVLGGWADDQMMSKG